MIQSNVVVLHIVFQCVQVKKKKININKKKIKKFIFIYHFFFFVVGIFVRSKLWQKIDPAVKKKKKKLFQ
jgi:hypothetical protein